MREPDDPDDSDADTIPSLCDTDSALHSDDEPDELDDDASHAQPYDENQQDDFTRKKTTLQPRPTTILCIPRFGQLASRRSR